MTEMSIRSIPRLVAVLAGLLLFPVLTAGTGEEARRLVSGDTLERTLVGGERHVYRLELGVGSHTLWVEQLGIDVVIELPDPAGVQRFDAPFDGQGREVVVFDLAEPASPLVVVRARDEAAAPGRYHLLLAPGAETPPRRAAERATSQALAAHAEALEDDTAEPVERAILALDTAIAGWRASGDTRGEAEALHARALLRRKIDQRQDAETDLAQALELWRQLGHRGLEATALNDLGLLRQDAGDLDGARPMIEAAAELYRRIGDTANATIVQTNLCLIDHHRGALDTARACYLALIEPLEALGARGPLSNVLNSLGGVAYQQGDTEEARRRLGEALELYRALGDREGEAKALTNRASLLRYVGAWRDALADWDRALGLQRRVGDRRGEARTLNNLGNAYLALGESERALMHFEQALPLRHAVGDLPGEATTLTNLGTVYRQQGQTAKALAFRRRALALRQEMGRPLDEARTRLWIARDLHQLGELDQALVEVETALALFESLAERRYRAVARADRGRLLLALGRPEVARRELDHALAEQRALGDRWSEAETLVALAETERRRGAIGTARRFAEQAVAGLEWLRHGVGIPELRASFLAARHRAYELTIELALDAHRREPSAGHDRRALEAAERSRGRALLDLLDRSGIAAEESFGTTGSPIDTERLDRRRQLDEQLHFLGLRRLNAAARSDDALVATVDQDLERLAAERQRVEVALASVRRLSPTLAGPLDTPSIQALLEPGDSLIELYLGETTSVLWHVDRGGVESFPLPPRHTLEALARQAHHDLATAQIAAEESGPSPALLRLGQLLLAPLAGRLDGSGDGSADPPRLWVVPDGAFHALPFAALPLPDATTEPLVTRRRVIHLPSASTLAALRRPRPGGAATSAWRVAVLADPIFGPSDPRIETALRRRSSESATDDGGDGGDGPGERVALPALGRLPGTRREAEAITALLPPDSVWLALGERARRAALFGPEVAAAPIVHCATHGLIDDEHPEASGLVLSQLDGAGRVLDGFVGLRDLYRLRLAADLVVLSGCRTARGEPIRGEGLVGLGHAFFHAGARRIVASLWRVDDRATAELMERFYRAHLGKGLGPSAALRRAQLELRAEPRFRHPYHWAAFILQGDD